MALSHKGARFIFSFTFQKVGGEISDASVQNTQTSYLASRGLYTASEVIGALLALGEQEKRACKACF